VNHLNAGHHVEKLTCYMQQAAAPGRREIDFAGISLGVGDELWN
jgi:hypothetical protein